MKLYFHLLFIFLIPFNLQITGNKDLEKHEGWLQGKPNVVHQQMLLEIENFRRDPAAYKIQPTAPKIPDGSPIGNIMCEG